MNELKAYIGPAPDEKGLADYYLKSEADKVIARHKYKRCLAIAKWCDEVMMSCELRGYAVHRIWANRHQWAMRWKYRWLELAEKFKEAKDDDSVSFIEADLKLLTDRKTLLTNRIKDLLDKT